MLGLACGDALGAPAEFQTQFEVRRRWGTLTEMVGGGPWLPGEWTDDTGMALCIAEAISEDPDDPVPGAGRRFLVWQQTSKDVGSTISAALNAFQGDWPQAARSTPQALSGKAAGNGSLMRTLPVALAYHDEAAMLRASARLSAMTHWDPQAEVCCAAYCLWAHALLSDQDIHDAWHGALDRAQAIHSEPTPDTPGMEPLPPNFWSRLSSIESLTYDRLQPSGYAGYVVECLEAAVWCCLHAATLEEALVQAVNLAGEADTIAAVAGGAAGAYWGPDALPERWLTKLHQRDRLEDTARCLADLRRHAEVYSLPSLQTKPFLLDRISDRLFTGRHPLTARDVDTLAGLGVTHVLDLRESGEWTAPGKVGAEALAEMERRGMRRLHLTVNDLHPPTPAVLDQSFAFLTEAWDDPASVVYAHCRAGRERTGAVVTACLARREGTTFDAMLSRLNADGDVFWPMAHQIKAARAWLAAGGMA